LDKSVSVLRASGRLGFITPDSFLLGRFFSRLRQYIFAHSKVVRLGLFDRDFWESGVVGRPTIAVLERCDDAKARLKHHLTAIHFPTLQSTESGARAFSYPQRYLEAAPLKRLRLFFSRGEFDFVTRAERQPNRLGQVVSFASGLIGLRGQRSIVAPRKKGAKWYPGLVSGSEVTRFAILYGGSWLCLDESKLKSGYREARYFEPKLFLRQTGDSLVAAFDDANLLCLNNVHVGNLKDRRFNLHCIAALINSKLLNRFYRLISLESGRVLAQTDIETIELLPIPDPDAELQGRLAALGEDMGRLNKDRHSGRRAPSELERLERQIAATDEQIE